MTELEKIYSDWASLLAEAIGLLKESREFIGGDWRERRDDFLERSDLALKCARKQSAPASVEAE